MDFEAARRIMVDSQIRPNDVSEPRYVTAFMAVPREAFVPASKREIAYSELEIATSDERAMWIPRDIAKMLKALSPKRTDVALVIGAGAGYEAALLAQLTETVLVVEDNEDAVERLSARFSKLNYDQVAAIEAPLTKGLPGQGPFDIILICGMVAQVPDGLKDQLGEGGRLGAVVQRDPALGKARIYTRAGGAVAYRDAFDCTPPRFAAFDLPEAFVF